LHCQKKHGKIVRNFRFGDDRVVYPEIYLALKGVVPG